MYSNPIRYAPVFAVLVLAACNNFLNEWSQKAAVNPVSAPVPVIGTGPEGARYNRNAAAAALTVEVQNGERIAAAGGILSYQWYANSGNSNAGGTAIEGAEDAGYTPPTGTPGTVYYYVKITSAIADNGDGGEKTASALSTAAAIVVDTRTDALPPAITGYPQGAVYRLGAEPAALTVTAHSLDGGDLSYQWFENGVDSNAGGTAIPDATGAHYTPSASYMGTRYYYAEIANIIEDNGDGGVKRTTAVSNAAAIAVNDKVNAFPPVISSYPQGAVYRLGADPVDLTILAHSLDGGGLSYQWYWNREDSNDGWTEIPGAAGARYTPPTDTAGTVYYYAEVANTIADNGDGGVKRADTVSNTAAITVKGVFSASSITLAVVDVQQGFISYEIQPNNLYPPPDYYDIYYRQGVHSISGGPDFTGWSRIPGAQTGLINAGLFLGSPSGSDRYSLAAMARKAGYDAIVSNVVQVFHNVIDLDSLPANAAIRGIGWKSEGGALYEIAAGANVTIKGNGRANGCRFTVDGTAPSISPETSITLDGVNLRPTAASPLDITGGSVRLNLVSSSTLTAPSNKAAIHAGSGVTLTIAGSGSLTAEGDEGGAGIGGGGGGGGNGGVITINGGTVNALSGFGGAGIGGGGGNGGVITINGGTVKAEGGEGGAGIGSGTGGGDGGNITINGGTVIAHGGTDGAGIGGGTHGNGGNISINGGTVIAQGGERGAGIGGGTSGAGGEITITGGTVNVQGGNEGAGIGGGEGGNGGTISISGDVVVAAQGGSNSAGIGGGTHGNGGNISIGDGTVVAQGGSDGAGIGGGYSGPPGTFNIPTPSWPIIFASSIQGGTGTMQDGIATNGDLVITITPGTFPDNLFGNIMVKLQNFFTVPPGATLTIRSNMTLDLNSHPLINDGTVDNQGSVSGGIVYNDDNNNWTGNQPQ